MNWLHDLSYFFAGVFFINALPHIVRGVIGQPFQTPFAKPPGKGLSSSTVNVAWGFFNLVVGYVLLFRPGVFDPRAIDQIAALGLGVLLFGLFCAQNFGKLHGGDLAEVPRQTP